MKATKRLAVVPLRPGYCRSYSSPGGLSAAQQEQTAQLFEMSCFMYVVCNCALLHCPIIAQQVGCNSGVAENIRKLKYPPASDEGCSWSSHKANRKATRNSWGLCYPATWGKKAQIDQLHKWFKQTCSSKKTTESKLASNNNLSTEDPISIVVAKRSTSNWTKGLPEELGVSIFKEKDAGAILPSKVMVSPIVDDGN